MKNFIIKSIVYVGVILILSILLDLLISFGLRNVNSYTIRPWVDMQIGNMNHDILVLGNSRAQKHINPAILDSILGLSTYNLGTEAHHMGLDILKYHYYKLNNKKPKYIIYQIDLATFHPTRLKFSSNNEQFLPFFDEKFLRNEFAQYDYGKLDLYLPLFRYFGNHKAIWWGIAEGIGLSDIKHLPVYKGFRVHTTNPIMSDIGFHQAYDIEQVDMLNSFNLEDTILIDFEEFIKECISDSLKILFVYTPMYSKVMSQLSDKAEFDLYIDSISKRYNIPYVDYTLDEEFCSNLNYFATPGHLNYSGASAITTKLAHDIDSIGWLE